MAFQITPQSADILGIFTFLYIGILSIYLLKTGKRIQRGQLVILLIIGIIGLIIDSWSVYITFIR